MTGEPEVYAEEFDVLVRNEAEITFRQFLDDYRRGEVAPRYESDEKADLSGMPPARYDLLRHPKRYVNFTLQFSRGCPHECEFCDATTSLGRRQRTRPVEAFLRDLEAILARGYRGLVFIADDNFAASPRKAIELCHALQAWNESHGNPFSYYTEAGLDIAQDDQLLDGLEQARFESIFIGLETPSNESLAGAGKRQNVGVDAERAVRKIQSHSIRVDGGFVVGFDTDTPDIFQRQARFIEEIGVSQAMVGILTALPGTPLFRRLRSAGRLLFDRTPLDLSGDGECYNVGGHVNFAPANFSRKELLAGYSRLLADIYHPGRYFDRVLKQISRMRPDPRFPRATRKWRFFVFPLLSLAILFCWRFRGHYLRAAAVALLRHPRLIREFAFLSMCGIHYVEFTHRKVLPWIDREIARLRTEQRRAPESH